VQCAAVSDVARAPRPRSGAAAATAAASSSVARRRSAGSGSRANVRCQVIADRRIAARLPHEGSPLQLTAHTSWLASEVVTSRARRAPHGAPARRQRLGGLPRPPPTAS